MTENVYARYVDDSNGMELVYEIINDAILCTCSYENNGTAMTIYKFDEICEIADSTTGKISWNTK